jgi:hypothetical protein
VVLCINLPVNASFLLCYNFFGHARVIPGNTPRYLEFLAILMPKLGARLCHLLQSTPSD